MAYLFLIKISLKYNNSMLTEAGQDQERCKATLLTKLLFIVQSIAFKV